eukprot:TRINITY_DN8007_c0_g1_i2.p2 TRINITY_DN8007_c0_g1~~TRINITY_DN8007_c0_g1_i2.p2  ORF type:complete len:233 (+),score=17.66 TRINITY_DN8007_c0_g1_i2:232-930(+)
MPFLIDLLNKTGTTTSKRFCDAGLVNRSLWIAMTQIRRNHDLGSILQGMKSHANSVSVHRLGTKALLTMAAKDEQQCLSLGGDVALTTLVIALRQHTSEQDVVANVLSCLSLITAASSDAPEILIGKDLAVLLARVMSDHLSNDDIQEQACWLIEAFGKHEGSDYLSLLAPQIVPQLLQSARHHASNTTVLESALQAAAPMLSDNSEYVRTSNWPEVPSPFTLVLGLPYDFG